MCSLVIPHLYSLQSDHHCSLYPPPPYTVIQKPLTLLTRLCQTLHLLTYCSNSRSFYWLNLSPGAHCSSSHLTLPLGPKNAFIRWSWAKVRGAVFGEESPRICASQGQVHNIKSLMLKIWSWPRGCLIRVLPKGLWSTNSVPGSYCPVVANPSGAGENSSV